MMRLYVEERWNVVMGGVAEATTFLHAFPPFYPIILFLFLSVCLNLLLFCDLVLLEGGIYPPYIGSGPWPVTV